MTGLLSVVMPTYNGERYVAAALESLLAQRDDGVELIVVDDGSSDGTAELVERLTRGTPTRLLRPGRLGSWVAASNLGLREARGEWACFLHQDDLWLPGTAGEAAGRAAREPAAPCCSTTPATSIRPARRWAPGPARSRPETSRRRPSWSGCWSRTSSPSPPPPSAAPPRSSRAGSTSGSGSAPTGTSGCGWARPGRSGSSTRPWPPSGSTPSRRPRRAPIGADEWAEQLGTVLERHLAAWPGAGARRRRVEKRGAGIGGRQLDAGGRGTRQRRRGLEPVAAAGCSGSAPSAGAATCATPASSSGSAPGSGWATGWRGGAEVAAKSTRDAAYTERLAGLDAWWKRLLDVQRPYRNYLRSLRPGRFLEVGCGLGRNLHNARGFADGLGIDHNPTSVEVARLARPRRAHHRGVPPLAAGGPGELRLAAGIPRARAPAPRGGAGAAAGLLALRARRGPGHHRDAAGGWVPQRPDPRHLRGPRGQRPPARRRRA